MVGFEIAARLSPFQGWFVARGEPVAACLLRSHLPLATFSPRLWRYTGYLFAAPSALHWLPSRRASGATLATFRRAFGVTLEQRRGPDPSSLPPTYDHF
jgi:hypothetical protein